MVDSQTKGIIQLLRSVLTGEKAALPKDFSLEAARETIREHQIFSMAYFGALACGIPGNQPEMAWLFDKTCKAIVIDERQKAMLQSLTQRFEAENIDYLLLKGSVLKALYPQPDMRMMSDADILIRPEQYDAIRKIMREEGYRPGQESDHELHWEAAFFHVELHKRVVPSYDKDLYAYYHEGWDFAVPSADCLHRYELKPEDLLVYLITHTAKHYRDGGIGIKHFCDLWLFRRKHPRLDMVYVRRELKKLKLDRFYKNVEHTLAAWFGDKPMTKTDELITNKVFSSGAYGTEESISLSDAARRSKNGNAVRAKLSKAREVLFPSYENMCLLYPSLKKMPVLLPGCWGARWVRTVFFRKEKIHQNMREIHQIDGDKIKKIRKELDEVGLPLNPPE